MKKRNFFIFILFVFLLVGIAASCAGKGKEEPSLSLGTLEIIAEDQLGIAEGKYVVRYSISDSFKSTVAQYMKLGLSLSLAVTEIGGAEPKSVPVSGGAFIVEEGKNYQATVTATINGKSKSKTITITGASVSENDLAVCNTGGLDVPMFFAAGGSFASFYDRISMLIQYFNLEGKVITESNLSVTIAGVGETDFKEAVVDLEAPLDLPQGSYLATMKIGSGTNRTNKVFNIYVGAEKTFNDYKYISTNAGIAILSYTGKGTTSLSIDSLINGAPVVAIGAEAFKNYPFLQSLTIPGSVNYICESAFEGCTNIDTLVLRGGEKIGINAFKGLTSLTELTLPDSILKLGSGSFAGCTALKSVALSSKLITLPAGVFEGCVALNSVTYKGSTANIGIYAFRACSALTKAEIPGTVVNLNPRAFQDTPKLTAYEVRGNSKNFASENGIIYRKITVGDSKQYALYMYPQGKTERNYSSQESKYATDWISAVGDYAFLNNPYLVTINFDMRLRTLGKYAFKGCSSVQSFNLGGNIKEISYGAFSGCSTLASFNNPDIESVGDYAFENCGGLISVSFSAKLKSFGISVFSGATALKNITVETSNANFLTEDGILYNKSKTALLWYPWGKTNAKYYLPESVRSIGVNVDFYKCARLEEVYIIDPVPPTLATLNFDDSRNLSIFVAENALDNYAAAPVWSNNATGLKNILYHYIASETGGVTELRPSGKWIARKTAYGYENMLSEMKKSTRGYSSEFETGLELTSMEDSATHYYKLKGEFIFYPTTLTSFYLIFEFDEMFYTGEGESRVLDRTDEIFHLYIAEGLEGSNTWFYMINKNQKSCWEEIRDGQHKGKAWAHLIEHIMGGSVSATTEGLAQLALLRAFQLQTTLGKYLLSEDIVKDVKAVENYMALFITNDSYIYSSVDGKESFSIENVQLRRVVSSAVNAANTEYTSIKNELFGEEQVYFAKSDPELSSDLDYYDMVMSSITIGDTCYGNVNINLDKGALSSFNIDIEGASMTVTVDDPEYFGRTKEVVYIFSLDFTYSGKTIADAGNTLPVPDFPDLNEFFTHFINVNT